MKFVVIDNAVGVVPVVLATEAFVTLCHTRFALYDLFSRDIGVVGLPVGVSK